MTAAVFRKCLLEARLLWLSLALLLFFFCWIRVWIVSMLETPKFATIIDVLWPKFGELSPVSMSELISYPGRVALVFVEPIVVFGVAIWAIARGSDVVSGEVDRGTMEMLLGQPVSRLQVLATQSCVTVLGLALLCAACWLGSWIGLRQTVVRETVQPEMAIPLLAWKIPIPFVAPTTREVPLIDEVDPALLLPPCVNLFAYGFAIAGLAAAMSSWDRYRWRTIGIVTGAYIVQTILRVISLLAAPVNWLKWLTLATAFEPQWHVALARHGQAWSFFLDDHDGSWAIGPMSCNATLLAFGLVCYLIAAVVFTHRDLPAPL